MGTRFSSSREGEVSGIRLPPDLLYEIVLVLVHDKDVTSFKTLYHLQFVNSDALWCVQHVLRKYRVSIKYNVNYDLFLIESLDFVIVDNYLEYASKIKWQTNLVLNHSNEAQMILTGHYEFLKQTLIFPKIPAHYKDRLENLWNERIFMFWSGRSTIYPMRKIIQYDLQDHFIFEYLLLRLRLEEGLPVFQEMYRTVFDIWRRSSQPSYVYSIYSTRWRPWNIYGLRTMRSHWRSASLWLTTMIVGGMMIGYYEPTPSYVAGTLACSAAVSGLLWHHIICLEKRKLQYFADIRGYVDDILECHI
jgi:phage anti-repressor protein